RAPPGYRLANELQPGKPALEEALRGLDARLGGSNDGMTEVLFIVSAGTAPALRAQQFRLPVPVSNKLIIIPFSFPLLVPGPFNDDALALTARATAGGGQRLLPDGRARRGRDGGRWAAAAADAQHEHRPDGAPQPEGRHAGHHAARTSARHLGRA